MLGREVQRALGHRVAVKLIGELSEDRTAEGQVAQVILERGEAGDSLTAYPEGGNAVGDHLFGVGNDLEDREPQRLECARSGSSTPLRYSSISRADTAAESKATDVRRSSAVRDCFEPAGL
jgi:hypothetical protein